MFLQNQYFRLAPERAGEQSDLPVSETNLSLMIGIGRHAGK